MEWHSKGITHEDIVMASFYLTEVRTNPPIVIDILVGKARAENQHCSAFTLTRVWHDSGLIYELILIEWFLTLVKRQMELFLQKTS